MTTTIQVKEKPILFCGEMVNAILSGNKIQTRRVIKPQPKIIISHINVWGYKKGIMNCPVGSKNFIEDYSPYGQVGDRLWVRETWGAIKNYDCIKPKNLFHLSPEIGYKTDSIDKWCQTGCNGAAGKWRPSIFMPRWASRINLQITDIKIDRVQSITNEDSYKEGVYGAFEFKHLWDRINKKRGYGWDKNPWVWVISFKQIG